MLRRLGVRLTLINVLISGVILIAMAFVVLRTAENVITSQYEKDLQTFSSQIVKLAVQTATDGGDTRIRLVQSPSKYAIYVSDETLDLSTDDMLTEDDVKDILPEIYIQMSDEIPTVAISGGEAKPAGDDGLFVSASLWQGTLTDDLQSGERAKAVMTFITYTASEPYFYTINGTEYRVSASAIGSTSSGENLILIAQDRTDELNSRDNMRWMFVFCIAGGLVLIVLASLFLSSRAIRPVEASIRQQREFVAAASHELRTPVAAISANAEVLGDAAIGEFAPYLNSIQSESARMSHLVSDMLDLARADAGELTFGKTVIDAGEIASEAVSLMKPLADKMGLALRGDTEPAFMMGDADRLKQVLVALLSNALHYTPEGGEVIVNARGRGHHVTVTVTDSGIGIPDEHKPRVFDRFYRVDAARARAQGGAGLGLSIAAQYVKQMGGTIQILDREGGGSIFKMRFDAVSALPRDK